MYVSLMVCRLGMVDCIWEQRKLSNCLDIIDTGFYYRLNRELTYKRALHRGSEFKNKGVNIAVGPVVGPLEELLKEGVIGSVYNATSQDLWLLRL